jgi:NAD+-dependent protein deacetylase sirtuin 4
LNPAWAAFLQEILATGALATEHPEERRQLGLRANPDGDVDVPDAPYSTFRYPACPVCLTDRTKKIELDADGAWLPSSADGVLKPSVIMFGESISDRVKRAAEEAIDSASRILVVGSSLATYSAWRLVKRAKENGMPIGILNLGGVRGEEAFFQAVDERNNGAVAFRASEYADRVLPEVVKVLEEMDGFAALRNEANSAAGTGR